MIQQLIKKLRLQVIDLLALEKSIDFAFIIQSSFKDPRDIRLKQHYLEKTAVKISALN